MNPFEIARLETFDLICEKCGRVISTREYLDNEGICDICVKELPEK